MNVEMWLNDNQFDMEELMLTREPPGSQVSDCSVDVNFEYEDMGWNVAVWTVKCGKIPHEERDSSEVKSSWTCGISPVFVV